MDFPREKTNKKELSQKIKSPVSMIPQKNLLRILQIHEQPILNKFNAMQFSTSNGADLEIKSLFLEVIIVNHKGKL
jgi:hypothetical protein